MRVSPPVATWLAAAGPDLADLRAREELARALEPLVGANLISPAAGTLDRLLGCHRVEVRALWVGRELLVELRELAAAAVVAAARTHGLLDPADVSWQVRAELWPLAVLLRSYRLVVRPPAGDAERIDRIAAGIRGRLTELRQAAEELAAEQGLHRQIAGGRAVTATEALAARAHVLTDGVRALNEVSRPARTASR